MLEEGSVQIMIKKCLKHINLLVLTVVLPFVYGCGAGGGGIGALTSFLFGGSVSSIGLLSSGTAGSSVPLGIASAAGDSVISGGAELAALHNPEPATMLLLGSGVMAMTYFKSRKNRNSKKP